MIVGIEEAVGCLVDGGVVAYPTETVYGLGVDATSPSALEALAALTGREPERALSILVADRVQLEARVPKLPDAARQLAQRFWPGPLTLVVPVGATELVGVASALGVGFRCSPQLSAAALARRCPRPIVSTSANRSGERPCHSAEEVAACFGAELPIVGGERAGGFPPSTVVGVDEDGKLVLLRAGAIPYVEVVRELGA